VGAGEGVGDAKENGVEHAAKEDGEVGTGESIGNVYRVRAG
jgi:hypothetical protein